jgi:hypothetical protein
LEVEENTHANIGCPHAGQVVKRIEFASFGTPIGSCATGFATSPTCDSNHSVEVVAQACVGQASCVVDATCSTFHENMKKPDPFCYLIKKSLAVNVTCGAADETERVSPSPSSATAAASSASASSSSSSNSSISFLADFGKEFIGGLRLAVEDGVAGTNVTIACGEALARDNTGRRVVASSKIRITSIHKT